MHIIKKGDFMDEIEKNIEYGKEFVRHRITELRLKTGISEYQMSLELGQNKMLYSIHILRQGYAVYGGVSQHL